MTNENITENHKILEFLKDRFFWFLKSNFQTLFQKTKSETLRPGNDSTIDLYSLPFVGSCRIENGILIKPNWFYLKSKQQVSRNLKDFSIIIENFNLPVICWFS